MVEKVTLQEIGEFVKEWATEEEIDILFGFGLSSDLESLGLAFLNSAFSVREEEDGKVIYRTVLGEFEVE